MSRAEHLVSKAGRTLGAGLAVSLMAACGGGPDLGPIDRGGLPAPTARPDWRVPAVETWAMPNGLTVWLMPQRQAPLISLRMVFPRGSATDPPGKSGLTALMADMLDEGAGGQSALALSEAFQRLATDYGAAPATDGLTVSLDLLADTLESSLALLADVLRRPTLDATEFERRKQQHLAAALAAESDPGTAAMLALRRALYGEGYGAWPANGIRGTLEKVALEDVKAHHHAVVQPTGATIVVAGDIDRATLEAALTQALGDWTGAPTAEPAALAPPPTTRAIHFIDFPGSTQSSVSVARRATGTEADDLFPALVMNRSLGGSFTGRLNMNLREDKGYTYGARSGFSRWRKAGMYSLDAAVKGETTRASVDEMLKELRGVAGEKPLSADERDRAVNGLLLSFPGWFETLGAVAGQLASMQLEGREVDWLRAWPDRVAEVDLAKADAAGRRWTGEGEFIIVIAGDHTQVAPTLTSLGLPIVRRDAQGNLLP